jgi:hypothetical protein
MRRFLTLVCLLCLAIPAGISISGCTRNPGAAYCNGLGYGLKDTDLDVLTLQPQTTGISIAYGQTHSVSPPTATTCKGTSAAVTSFTWGTSNNQLADVSPSGTICAGTWNRNSGGGIANYTICTPPTSPAASAVAYLTATSNAVTSNPVAIYVHAPVTALSLVGPTQCLSQGAQWPTPLDVRAYYEIGGAQTLLCAPNSTSVPSCSSAIGAVTYNVTTSSVAEIDNVTNLITAEMPGDSAITASISGTGGIAGYFSTCPPASIKVALADGATSGTVTQGVTQNLVTTVTDTNGNNITGLSLVYQSTDPMDISTGAEGAITANYPAVASITAICEPTSCNPAPINVFGEYGNGLSLASDPVIVTVPGTASQYAWYGAPGQSQYLVPVNMLDGTVGSTIRLPYVPNSMLADASAANIYFGSSHELMAISTVSGTLSTQNTSVPGMVLAVSPNNTTLVINDQSRQILDIFSLSGGIESSHGGMGTSASFAPDNQTVYITDSAAAGAGHSDTLYVFNNSTGWSISPLPSSNAATCASSSSCRARSLAVTVPSVGAYSSGTSTVANTWCPSGTVGNYANMTLYPQADVVPAQTDVLAATTDGKHILGAALVGAGVTLTDIGVTIPTTVCPGVASGAALGSALTPLFTGGAVTATKQVNVSATAVNQIVASPASNLAFVTYSADATNTNATLPYYIPAATGAGTLNYVTLTNGAAISAPVAGTFTPDNSLFLVSTAGDNQIHSINVKTLTDTQQISPNLPGCTVATDLGCTLSGAGGGIVPATAIVVKPRSTT